MSQPLYTCPSPYTHVPATSTSTWVSPCIPTSFLLLASPASCLCPPFPLCLSCFPSCPRKLRRMAHPHAHMPVPHWNPSCTMSCLPLVPHLLALFAMIPHPASLMPHLIFVLHHPPPSHCFDIWIWPHLTTIIFVLSCLVSSWPDPTQRHPCQLLCLSGCSQAFAVFCGLWSFLWVVRLTGKSVFLSWDEVYCEESGLARKVGIFMRLVWNSAFYSNHFGLEPLMQELPKPTQLSTTALATTSKMSVCASMMWSSRELLAVWSWASCWDLLWKSSCRNGLLGPSDSQYSSVKKVPTWQCSVVKLVVSGIILIFCEGELQQCHSFNQRCSN